MMTDKRSRRQVIRIDVLPDHVLLDIFDFFVNMGPLYKSKRETETWQRLAHVCRGWRTIVFSSPRRLNLQLYCTPNTPVKDTLDVWPNLPLIVVDYMDSILRDNVIAAMGQSNRVCSVTLENLTVRSEEVLAAMQVPFPELTELRLTSYNEPLPVIPDSFLDGSAPRLRRVTLSGIPFPGLPKLLLSATHLVDIVLISIPYSGYFSPEAIVALISALSSLKKLTLLFHSPQSFPGQETRRPPRPKRSVIPALTSLHFRGVIEYLEDLVTSIDTPELDNMNVSFFKQIDFGFPRLAQFINRTPTLMKRKAHVRFYDYFALVALRTTDFRALEISTSCKEPDRQLSAIEKVCNSSLHPISTVEELYIERLCSKQVWKNDTVEDTLWLRLLLPFTAVKHLYLSKEFAPGIAAALQELVVGRITEVLPSLQNIFVKGLEPSGPFQERIGRFVAARQLSNHPISISDWDTDLW